MSKRNYYLNWLIASSVALLGLIGCGDRSTAAPTGSQTNSNTTPSATPSPNVDRAEDAVESALEADTRLKPFDLDADENKGGIALKGNVQTAQQKTLAEEIAKKAAPNIAIYNQIRVGASSSPTGSRPVDADEAEDRVSDALEANTTLKPLDIEADEENGGILLKGTVQTAAQKKLAEDIARKVAPGFSLNNQIRVQ